jgi:hypothetical protein
MDLSTNDIEACIDFTSKHIEKILVEYAQNAIYQLALVKDHILGLEEQCATALERISDLEQYVTDLEKNS